jgi:hypothetical protein
MDAATRAQQALDDAKAYVGQIRLQVDAEALDVVKAAGEQIQRTNHAFVLALLKDEWCPAKLFAPWSSVRRIQDWGKAGKMDVQVKHGRTCCKPSEFFRYFNSLKE